MRIFTSLTITLTVALLLATPLVGTCATITDQAPRDSTSKRADKPRKEPKAKKEKKSDDDDATNVANYPKEVQDSSSGSAAPTNYIWNAIPRQYSTMLPDTTHQSAQRTDYNIDPRKYIVGKINLHGANAVSPQMILMNLGIQSGDTIEMPGKELILATRNLIDKRYFSDLKIGTTFRADTVDIDVYMQERTRVVQWDITGIKPSDIKNIKEKLGLRSNNELTRYSIDNSIRLIREFYNDKAYRNAKIEYLIIPDSTIPNAAKVVFDIKRGDKVKIGEFKFEGNENLPAKKLAKSMKKTHKVNINFFQSFKFKEKDFREDLDNILSYARSQGYRDAIILEDSIYSVPDKPKRIGLYIKMEEGRKYHYRNISWIGNTIYPTEQLQRMVGLNKGDVYDSEAMGKRLGNLSASEGDVSIRSMYNDQGYLAFSVEPVESVLPGDSVDVQIRIYEGSQFRIRNVTFKGNTRTNDHVIRRELYTQPGDLYSLSLLMGTYQRLATMGQFDAKSFEQPDIRPNFQQEQVDIGYSLVEVPNDQVEISGGWGGGMFIASVGINFTNVSLRKLFDPKAWKESMFYPTGDNQTVGIKVQTNGTYYRAASVNFIEPWLGGRKPTSLSVSFFTSRETNSYNIAQKATAYFGTIGGTIGVNKRLNWPDRSFVLSAGITLQSYNLYNWDYFLIKNGRSNTFAINLSIGRNSVDDPYQYSTRGSNISLSAAITPPWSLFDGKDYSQPMKDSERYKWIEYHKWKFNAQWFFPLTPKLVLMARAQFGYLGSYNQNKPSPFEGFQMGGDGLSGYSLYGVETVGLRGYKNNSLTPYSDYGTYASIFSKYTAELRYPLVRSGQTMVYALVFAEAGNAYQTLQSFKPFNLKRAAGVGLRVYLPFLGMLGIDWGYGFDAVSGTEPSGAQFHFSMGMQL